MSGTRRAKWIISGCLIDCAQCLLESFCGEFTKKELKYGMSYVHLSSGHAFSVWNPAFQAVLNCSYENSQNVTIGGTSGLPDVPIIGNNVEVGAGCNIIGPVRIGNNCIIGAGAVVINDITNHCLHQYFLCQKQFCFWAFPHVEIIV